MGTGVNVQSRVVRQGNQERGRCCRLRNEESFDVCLWQTLARKKNSIDQVLSVDAREIEDESSEATSYAQVKALATGNPLHIRRTELDSRCPGLRT